ncbi:hypothetical protein HK101_004102 [Irineochytrium annulatum]|nr:hypothetical protein HK101_004102 [Irineochytrium annulatum]
MCVGGKIDSLIMAAAKHAKIDNVASFFPQDLVLWIDPNCVSYRTGSDHGHIMTLWEDRVASAAAQQLQHQILLQQHLAEQHRQQQHHMMSGGAYTAAQHASASAAAALSAAQASGMIAFPTKTRVTMRVPDMAAAILQSQGSSPSNSASNSPMPRRSAAAVMRNPNSPIIVN